MQKILLSLRNDGRLLSNTEVFHTALLLLVDNVCTLDIVSSIHESSSNSCEVVRGSRLKDASVSFCSVFTQHLAASIRLSLSSLRYRKISTSTCIS